MVQQLSLFGGMKVTKKVSVSANGSVNDVLAGTRVKSIPNSIRRAGVSILATASASGLEMDAFIGNQSVVEQSIVSAQNRVPIIPDDVVTQEVSGGGNDIQINVRNTTASPIDFFYTVDVEPLG